MDAYISFMSDPRVSIVLAPIVLSVYLSWIAVEFLEQTTDRES